MKFRNKILVAIWSVILGIILLTGVIIIYWTRNEVRSRFSEDLRRNYSILQEIALLRAEQDKKSCQIIAETPRLKAVVELGDRNTVLQLLRELNVGAKANLFVIADTAGVPLGGFIDDDPSKLAPLVSRNSDFMTRATPRRGFVETRGEVYRTTLAPIVVGRDQIGTLTIGFRIGRDDLSFIKSLTNSEVLLSVGPLMLLATDSVVSEATLASVLRERSGTGTAGTDHGEIFGFSGDGESYVAAFSPIVDGAGRAESIRYLLFRPINKEVTTKLSPVLNALMVLSLIVLLVTAIIGYFISGSITKPIAELVRGTAEVSRGNYDIRIDVKSGGELKFLAKKFEEMGISLKENVRQLANRNTELQATLGQLKETQEERLRLAMNLQLLMESAGEGIFGIDNEGLCTFINRAGAAMLGYTPEEMIGKEMHSLTHHSDADGAPYPQERCPISIMLKSGKGTIVDDEVMWKRDRTSIPVEYSSHPILAEGGVRGAVVVFSDVTERRMLRQQLMQTQKIESIGRLAGGIAHDFNNILSIIIGHASLLRAGPAVKSSPSESIEAINRASHRGAGLVRQLLTFARKTELLLQPVKVNEIITEVANLITETFPKNIDISLRLGNNLPPILADANQLHQVMVNLCVNARDAMSARGTLTINTAVVQQREMLAKYPNAAAAEYLRLSVSDTGTGMDSKTLGRIFEPFFTTKEVGKGTGLGLSVVFGIVETHKGYINVQSAPGQGTTFNLFFPVLPRTSETPAAKVQDLNDLPGGSETILFVEDEEMLRDLIASVLMGKGYTVITATNGEEMVDFYARRKDEISLVISDVGLPKLDGFEAFKQIRDKHRSANVILASGYLEPNVKSEILKSGVLDFIQKPYFPDEVLKKVRQILDDKRIQL